MTKNSEKWSKYNIDDLLGTHLTFYDFNNDVIETFVFGRSSSDFSRCYIRLGDKPEVYLVNQNIMFNLQTRPEYWGEKLLKKLSSYFSILSNIPSFLFFLTLSHLKYLPFIVI